MAAPQQHKYDRVASNMLFISLLISSLVNLLAQNGLATFQSKFLSRPALLTVATLLVLLELVHYYYIRRGYRWAKILFFVFFGLNVLFLLVDFKGIAAKQFISPLKEINFVVQWLFQIAAFSLLVIGFKNTRWHHEQPSTTLDPE